MAVPHFDEERTGDEVNIIARVDTVIRTVYNPEEAPRNKLPAETCRQFSSQQKSAKMNLCAHLPTRARTRREEVRMGKKKAADRGGVSKRTPSKGLSETGLEAVADDGFAQMEEAEAAAAIAGGGARTVNPELQKRLDLLAELSRRGDIRGFVRVFVPHDLNQEDTDYFAGELEGDETRWKQLAQEVQLIADGSKVLNIIGDQETRAEFRYLMPGQSLNIQREVVFYCENGDWRAEG